MRSSFFVFLVCWGSVHVFAQNLPDLKHTAPYFENSIGSSTSGPGQPWFNAANALSQTINESFQRRTEELKHVSPYNATNAYGYDSGLIHIKPVYSVPGSSGSSSQRDSALSQAQREARQRQQALDREAQKRVDAALSGGDAFLEPMVGYDQRDGGTSSQQLNDFLGTGNATKPQLRAIPDADGFLPEGADNNSNPNGGFLANDLVPMEQRPDGSGFLPERPMTPAEVAETRADALANRRDQEASRSQQMIKLTEAERLHQQARENFQQNWLKNAEHPDIGGAPLSQNEIRKARQQINDGLPIDPSTQAKLDALQQLQEQAASRQRAEAEAQTIKKGFKSPEIESFLNTADSILKKSSEKSP